jgi:serine/threonine protein kinase
MQDIVTVQNHLYIITELLEGGTLQEMLSKRGALYEEEAMTIFRQLLAG